MKFSPKMLPLEPKHLLTQLVILDFRYQNIYTFVSGGFDGGLWIYHTYLSPPPSRHQTTRHKRIYLRSEIQKLTGLITWSLHLQKERVRWARSPPTIGLPPLAIGQRTRSCSLVQPSIYRMADQPTSKGYLLVARVGDAVESGVAY